MAGVSAAPNKEQVKGDLPFQPHSQATEDLIYRFLRVLPTGNDEKCVVCNEVGSSPGVFRWAKYELPCGHFGHTRCLRLVLEEKGLSCSCCGKLDEKEEKNLYCDTCNKRGHSWAVPSTLKGRCENYDEKEEALLTSQLYQSCTKCSGMFLRKKGEGWRLTCITCSEEEWKNELLVNCARCKKEFGIKEDQEGWRELCLTCFHEDEGKKVVARCKKCGHNFSLKPEQKKWRKVCYPCFKGRFFGVVSSFRDADPDLN